MTNVISAQDLRREINSTGTALTILRGVNMSVAAAESVAIVGKSGSGKTTLLSLLAGLDTPTSGSVHLDGVALFELDEDGRAAFRAGRVGFVFQSFQLLGGFTALENVMLPAELCGLEDAEIRARKALEQVGLSARLAHYPYQLSGGEQQRVAIARAFAAGPSSCLPTSPPATSTLPPARRSSSCCLSRTVCMARPWSWSRTTRRWPNDATAC